MLSLQAAESAYITAQNLDEKNIALVAKPGSLLAGLIATTYINHDPAQQNGEWYHDINAMCALTDSSSTATGYSEHTARMEEISDVLAEKLTKHLFFTRTVVAPFVDAYAGRLTQSMELISGNPDNGMEVVMHSQAGPLTEPSLVDSILRNREAIYVQEPLCARLPEQDDNQIRSMMITGAASVDSSINEYFTTKEEGWLASRWKEIFCQQSFNTSPSRELDHFISGRDNVATALMVFLVTRRIWNTPIEGTDMSAKSYEDTMVNYRTQSGLRLCHELERLDRDGQEGILVIGTEKAVGGARRIIVNSVVYRDFLKKGGTNEMLLGNLLQPQQDVRVDELIKNKDLLEASWERHHAHNKNYYDQKRLLQMRSCMVIEWESLAKEYTAEDFPIHERASAAAMVRRLAQNVTAKDFDNVSALSLFITCQARFYKTDAYDILNGIQRARENNPKISVQEAAIIATTEHACRWVGKQLVPVTANKLNVFSPKDTMLT